jgi:cytochrome c556
MTHALKATLALALTVTLLLSVASAHEGATGVVKERMEMMKSLAAAMKTVGQTLKDEVATDDAAIADAVAVMRSTTGTAMTKKFPAGSIDHPSEALPVIWERWPEFETIAERAYAASGVLAAAHASGDELNEPFAALAETCKACHRTFRTSKD